jgi:hypothetical protein
MPKVALIAIITLSLLSFRAHAEEHWPQVNTMHKVYHFNDADTQGFSVTLDGKHHHALYTLDCYGGDANTNNSEFTYSGLLACRLESLYAVDTVSTLFSETSTQIADWHNRGRFLTEHLRPGCAAYPDWGNRRTFRLRGMDITIAITDVKFGKSPSGKEMVKADTVEIDVKPDPTATTPLTEKPSLPEPAWFYHPDEKCTK